MRLSIDAFLADGHVLLQLHHLVSYAGMGAARVECAAGCACAPRVVDAHRVGEVRNVSVFEAVELAATAQKGPPCELVVTVLNATSSGGHKFKLRALVVTTPPAQTQEGSGKR